MVPWRQNLEILGEIWTPESKKLGEIWTPDLKRGRYEPRTGGVMSRGRYENAPLGVPPQVLNYPLSRPVQKKGHKAAFQKYGQEKFLLITILFTLDSCLGQEMGDIYGFYVHSLLLTYDHQQAWADSYAYHHKGIEANFQQKAWKLRREKPFRVSFVYESPISFTNF